jgi:hypothetical protein
MGINPHRRSRHQLFHTLNLQAAVLSKNLRQDRRMPRKQDAPGTTEANRMRPEAPAPTRIVQKVPLVSSRVRAVVRYVLLYYAALPALAHKKYHLKPLELLYRSDNA